MTNALADALRGIGRPQDRPRLEAFTALLLERGAQLNLTAARDPAAVGAHIADSLTLLRYLRDPFVDIGSGGGFPAIPLALASGYRATLVEATLKKAQFLREVAVALDLPVTVIAERAEIAGRRPDLRDRFASATARAVASAPAVLELTLPFLAPNGVAVLPRGELGEAERRATADAALVLSGELSGEIELDGRRRILLVTKRGPTPSRFPRRAGVPEKRPLCFTAATRRGEVERDGGRTALM